MHWPWVLCKCPIFLSPFQERARRFQTLISKSSDLLSCDPFFAFLLYGFKTAVFKLWISLQCNSCKTLNRDWGLIYLISWKCDRTLGRSSQIKSSGVLLSHVRTNWDSRLFSNWDCDHIEIGTSISDCINIPLDKDIRLSQSTLLDRTILSFHTVTIKRELLTSVT